MKAVAEVNIDKVLKKDTFESAETKMQKRGPGTTLLFSGRIFLYNETSVFVGVLISRRWSPMARLIPVRWSRRDSLHMQVSSNFQTRSVLQSIRLNIAVLCLHNGLLRIHRDGAKLVRSSLIRGGCPDVNGDCSQERSVADAAGEVEASMVGLSSRGQAEVPCRTELIPASTTASARSRNAHRTKF